MKKFVYLLAALTVIAACNQDIETPEVESNAKTVTVKAGKAGTKTAITQDGDNFLFTWTAGDKLAVIEAIPSLAQLIESDPEENYPYAAELYYTEALTADTDNAVFTLDLKERDYLSGQLQYVAIYPASCAIDIAGDYWDWDKDRMIVFIDFPRYQKPTASSFDPNADVLVSKLVTCPQRPDELSFQFARVGTIVKMVLTGLPEGAAITSGSVELGIEAGYYMEYDPVDQTIRGTDGTDGISFSYETPLEVGPDRSVTIWLRCMSGVSDQIELYLYGTANSQSTEWHRKVRLYAQGKSLEFKESGLTTFSLRMGKPDVDNPDPDEIDYYTNDNLDGVTVFWPLPGNPNLSGYDCFLIDENGGRHDFDVKGTEGTLYKATINSGLAPGVYSLSVRALAVDGKEPQYDYDVKDDIRVGVPISMTISYMSSYNPNASDFMDLSLSGYTDGNCEDYYRGMYFYTRNLDWQSRAIKGLFFTNSNPWAFWNKNAIRLTKLSIVPATGGDTKYQVYASDNFFDGGFPAETDTPLTGTYFSGGYYEGYTYQLSNATHFLIFGLQDLSISEIVLEFYK
ncbi:MAG: hypothetical protein J5702_05525 [Bacteroidales bacterium]|nr:hypothetical protein [Bacteroidales bacterium]